MNTNELSNWVRVYMISDRKRFSTAVCYINNMDVVLFERIKE